MNFKFETEKAFIEDKIKTTLDGLGQTFRIRALAIDRADSSDPDDVQEVNDLSEIFERNIKAIHRYVTAYFELMGVTTSLKSFNKLIEKSIDNRNLLFREKDTEDDLYRVSDLVTKIWEFLLPYQFIDQAYTKLLLKNKGLEYLDRILRNTQHIIHHEGKSPTSEPQVYNAVKFYLTTVIPSAEAPTPVFKKMFNYYAPDIVLPELHAIVEYKYITSKSKITKVIGEILEDEKQYSGNDDYIFFYAVFYLTEAFITEDELKALWNSFHLPERWRPIFIFGRNYRTKMAITTKTKSDGMVRNKTKTS